MKTNIKIILFSMCTILLIFTSCQKEEGCMDPLATNYNPSAESNDGSCTYIIGCTDSQALNYDINAGQDDNSCIYAHNLAQGIWAIDPDCDEISILGQTFSINEQLPDSINVQGEENNVLFIDIDGTVVSGEIDNDGNITVESQTVSLDIGLGPIDVDVEGDGLINLDNTGEMQLTYSFEIPLVGSQSINCDIILHK